MRAEQRCKGDVAWILPGKKKPFVYSTVSDSDFIEILAEEGKTWNQIAALEYKGGLFKSVQQQQYFFNETVQKIVQTIIAAGYGDCEAVTFLNGHYGKKYLKGGK